MEILKTVFFPVYETQHFGVNLKSASPFLSDSHVSFKQRRVHDCRTFNPNYSRTLYLKCMNTRKIKRNNGSNRVSTVAHRTQPSGQIDDNLSTLATRPWRNYNRRGSPDERPTQVGAFQRISDRGVRYHDQTDRIGEVTRWSIVGHSRRDDSPKSAEIRAVRGGFRVYSKLKVRFSLEYAEFLGEFRRSFADSIVKPFVACRLAEGRSGGY